VGELEREKVQALAAWEQGRSDLVLETTSLQAKLAALAGTDDCEAASSSALKRQVAILQDFVVTCRSEFALVMSATQEWEALVAAVDQKNQGIEKHKHVLEGVIAEAGRVCGQAAEDLAEHMLRVEDLEQKVRCPSSPV
jgi:hypothetical protein